MLALGRPSALVALPCSSKATLTAGPRFSTILSACAAANSDTITAKRRGDANQRTCLNCNSAFSNSASKLLAAV